MWYLFLRVSILTLSTIFLLDCGGNVQTGWYLFASVSILTFSTIFLLDLVQMFSRVSCINFDPFYDFSIGLWCKCSAEVVFVS